MGVGDEGGGAGVLGAGLRQERLRSRSAGGGRAGSSGEIGARTPREVDGHAPSLAPVIALAHCACVSKAWRGAVLRRLVRVLSPPFDPWSRAGAAAASATTRSSMSLVGAQESTSL